MKFMENYKSEPIDDLRPEYDCASLGVGIRGKHFQERQNGTNVAFLTPEVRNAFPTDDELNEALQMLIRIAKRQGSRI